MLLQLLRLLLWGVWSKQTEFIYTISVALPKIAVGINVIIITSISLGNKLMGNQEGFTLRLMAKYLVEEIK
jgi:hypothetical protein